MKDPMSHLGVILLSILLTISLGSLVLFLSQDTGNLYGIGMGIVLIVIVLTFISYLLYDLYDSIQEEQPKEQQSSYKRLS